jgi:hypothetical protein
MSARYEKPIIRDSSDIFGASGTSRRKERGFALKSRKKFVHYSNPARKHC